MAKSGKILSVIALIFGLSGVLVGGFALIQINFSGLVQQSQYVLPMARAYLGVPYDLFSGSTVKFNYTDKIYDSHDAFDLSSDAYIVPESGSYQVVAQYDIGAEDQDFFVIEIYINTVFISSRTYTTSLSGTTNFFSVSITDILNVNEGDAISIYAYIYLTVGTQRTLFPGAQYTYFSIFKIN